MQKIFLILNLSIILADTPFKGYIKHGSYSSSYQYPYVYAEGNYLDGLMDGEWKFYTDSTKHNIIAKGNFLSGNTSNPSKDGIPRHGRNGLWKHYYTKNLSHWDQKSMDNSLRATQYWNNGKLDGKSTSYFKDGKIAIESYYKNGKRDGKRKEWYQGGYMYTKLYRETNYKQGQIVSDKIYDYINTKLSISSSYLDDIRIDTIYSSNHNKKLFVQQIKNKKYHGDFIAYHLNGNIWIKGQFNNGITHGKWEEFSDQGLLLAQMNYNNGETIIEDGYNQKIYDTDGRLMYSYQFIDKKRTGEAIELLYRVPNIIYNPSIINPSINSLSYNRIFSQTTYHISMDRYESYPSKYHSNIKYHIIKYKHYNLIPFLNPYQTHRQYSINYGHFTGFNQKYNENGGPFKIMGYGNYNNNKRVGDWVWKTLDNKIVLIGQYNEDGIPIGQWKEIDMEDNKNFIITQYDNNGKIKSVSKNITTHLNKKER